MSRLSRPRALPTSARACADGGAEDYVQAQSERVALASRVAADRAADQQAQRESAAATRETLIRDYPEIARSLGYLR